VILRRVTNLDLILYGMRRVVWLHTATVFWLGGEIISLSCSMYMGLMILGRYKYIQQNHQCLIRVPLRMRWLMER